MSLIGDNAYYRQLCEHLGMAVVATDRELNIVSWNAAAARTFGAAADRMAGTPISRILPQERREAAEGMVRRAIETGETILLEFEHRDAQGRRRELAGTIAPVVLEDGQRVGASICIRDITRRIDLQARLHESHKMASLGEMAGAIAHHFNNILGGVVTSIDYALASGNVSAQGRVLEQVGVALQRATGLVSGLLAFAEGDRRSDDESDLTELINDLADKTEAQVQGRNTSFLLKLPPMPVVPVPRFPVATALTNIVRNAIEAMPEGGKLLVDVSLNNETVVILVEDTGCGLDEMAKSRIFEPFWSTKDQLSSGATEGIGLGLAIAHGLIQMIGGTITVTSQVGKGSCFRVTLPRRHKDQG